MTLFNYSYAFFFIIIIKKCNLVRTRVKLIIRHLFSRLCINPIIHIFSIEMPKKGNDDDASVASERFQPLKNVASLMGEGEKFCRDQLFAKAIQCYTEVHIKNLAVTKQRKINIPEMETTDTEKLNFP